MMLTLASIFWLGTKELRSVLSDIVLLPLIIWSFSFAIYEQASSMGETVNNASIAFVDEDHGTVGQDVQTNFEIKYEREGRTFHRLAYRKRSG